MIAFTLSARTLKLLFSVVCENAAPTSATVLPVTPVAAVSGVIVPYDHANVLGFMLDGLGISGLRYLSPSAGFFVGPVFVVTGPDDFGGVFDRAVRGLPSASAAISTGSSSTVA